MNLEGVPTDRVLCEGDPVPPNDNNKDFLRFYICSRSGKVRDPKTGRRNLHPSSQSVFKNANRFYKSIRGSDETVIPEELKCDVRIVRSIPTADLQIPS
jgi:hypothetical protein